MMTPYEKLISLPDVEKYLKSETSLEDLKKLAHRLTDNEAAKALHTAKRCLFNQIFEQEKLRHPMGRNELPTLPSA